MGCLADAALYSARRHAAPLAVATSGARLGGEQMMAALLSNDQASTLTGSSTAGLLTSRLSGAQCSSWLHALHPHLALLQTPVAPLERELGRARLLYGAGAYLHTYVRHGLRSGDVGEALEATASLLDAYKAL